MKAMENGVDFGAFVRGVNPERVFDTWKADSGGDSTTAVVIFEARDDGTFVHLTEKEYEDSHVGLQDPPNRTQG